MPDPSLESIHHIERLANDFQHLSIACPRCVSGKGYIRWGFYYRYAPGGESRVRIQRYYCLNQACDRKTFSIAPFPILPVIRFTLCVLLALLGPENHGKSTARIARERGLSWAAARRARAMAERIGAWIERESKTAPWAFSSCLDPPAMWPSFHRAFSWAFFPARLR